MNNNGIDKLAWKLPAEIGVGDTTKFSFTINGSPSDLECGVLQLSSQITTYGGAVCSKTNSFCNIDIATADTLKNIFIYKGYLDISNSGGSYSVANVPSGETGNISFDIFNSGETISVGTETIVQYYQDTDNDGVYSSGDTYVTNDTIVDELTGNSSFSYLGSIDIPAGFSCKLIAVIDTSLNPCTCTPSQILINLPLMSSVTSHTICSEDVIQVGSAAVNNYNYSWNSLTNLSDSLLAQPNFNVEVFYPATDTFELIRTVDRLGCTSTDTTNVIVYSKPVSTAGADQSLCSASLTTLSGNQPEGTTNGLWSMDASQSQPSLVNFSDATQFNTNVSNLQEGIYSFVWSLSNGNCPTSRDTLRVAVYNQPIANAGLDQKLCEYSSTFLTGSPSTGTSGGYWMLDPNYNQAGTLSFSDSTLYNSQISNLSIGSYQLIWTLENGTCTPSKDTVLISNYNFPTADAGEDSIIKCAPSVIELNGFSSSMGSNYEYEWTTFNGVIESGINTLNPAVSKGGNYILTINDTLSGCVNIDSVTISQNYSASVSILLDNSTDSLAEISTYQDYEYTYTGDEGPIEWFIDDNNVSNDSILNYSFIKSGEHIVKIILTNLNNGCIVSDSLILTTIHELKIPGAISINGDGLNDYFMIRALENYDDNSLTIFNRWGNSVFEASPYLNDWEGQSNSGLTITGEKVVDGTYFYILKLIDDNKEFIYKGAIEVKRK